MSRRTEQIGSLLQHELAAIIATEVELPPGSLVTVTAVDVAPNLQSAKVWCSVLPFGTAGSVLTKLRKVANRLTSALYDRVEFRPMPKLLFVLDASEERAEHIDELLNRIKDDVPPPADPATQE